MNRVATFLIVAALILPASLSAQAASQTSVPAGAVISGVVHDASGRVVVGAAVTTRVPSGAEHHTTTDSAGRFSLAPPAPGEVTLIVRAPGFAEWRMPALATSAAAVDVQLEPAGIQEQVTVTPTRSQQQLGTIPASVSVLNQEEIQRRPAIVPDDLLRQLPEFSLFRRSSSLSAHPTSQGVSLRGIGPSGVSRTLVLLDGVPYNDPFGGWVYWTGIPLNSADRIEVVDNASSSLYGNYAMGGVINILTSKPTRRTVEFKTLYGSRNTPKVEF